MTEAREYGRAAMAVESSRSADRAAHAAEVGSAKTDSAFAGDIDTTALLRRVDRENLAPHVFDLHVHTTVSDGSDSFKDVLLQAKKRGLEGVAFTNHDSTAGLDYARELGNDFGVAVIGGIEISAWDAQRGRKVHILGFGLQSDSPAIEALCKPLRKRRTENTLWQLDRLVEAGLIRNRQTALDFAAASTAFYKQHLMDALTGEPHASTAYQELYRALFKGEGICVRDIEYVDACEAVAAIIEDGGVPVLAHPGQLDSYDLVPDLVASGLAGIEKYHPDHTAADHRRCDDLAERYNLLRTGGSDYHGKYGDIPHLGFARAENQDSFLQ